MELAGGASVSVFADFGLDGRRYDIGGMYGTESSMFLFVSEVQNLTNPEPEPAPVPIGPLATAAALLGLGVAALVVRRR